MVLLSHPRTQWLEHTKAKTRTALDVSTSFFPSKLQTLITFSIFHEIKNRKNQNCSIFRKESNGTTHTNWNSKYRPHKAKNQNWTLVLKPHKIHI